MLVGSTVYKNDGNPYYSPSFPRGGLAAVFVADVTHVEQSPTFKIAVEHRDEHDTTWSTASTFADFTAVDTKTLDVTGLKQIIRFKYEFDAGDASTVGVHFLMQAPTWRPYP
jgi:hypothetical protein